MYKIGNDFLLLEVVKDKGEVRDFVGNFLLIYRYNTNNGFTRDDENCITGDHH